jgi:hypothetical protein
VAGDEIMTLRDFSARVLEPVSIALMVGGIAALCQPWHLGLHSYGVTIILVGLVGFNVAAHVPPPARKDG